MYLINISSFQAKNYNNKKPRMQAEKSEKIILSYTAYVNICYLSLCPAIIAPAGCPGWKSRYNNRFTIMSRRSNDMALRNFNKGMSLLYDGQQEEALECLMKAEKDSRDADSPELLVNVLQAIGGIMESDGRIDEAIDMYVEASGMLESIANSDPSFIEHKALLMGKTASLLTEQGDNIKAIPFFEEAFSSYERLLAREPGNDGYCSSAASAANDLASILASEGRNERAKEMFEKALMLSGKLVVLDPVNMENTAKALTVQTNLANLLYEMGIMQEARQNLEHAYDGCSGAMKDDPSNSVLQEQLLMLLERLVYALMATGEYDDAKDRIYELVEMLPRSSTYDSSFSGRFSDLFHGLIKLACRRSDEGLVDDTRSIYETSLVVILKLLGEESGNIVYQDMFRNILVNMEKLLAIDSPEADKEADYNVLISMYEKLWHMAPRDLSHRTKIARLHDERGRFLMNAGRSEDARHSYNMSLAIRDELIKAGESPLLHEFGIASIKNNLGTILAKEGYSADAKTMFEESLKGYTDLLDRFPDEPVYEDGAALTLNNLAKLLADLGRCEDAKSIYESALEIYAELIKTEPEKASYKKHAARTLENLSSLLDNMGRTDDSLLMYESARELLEDI